MYMKLMAKLATVLDRLRQEGHKPPVGQESALVVATHVARRQDRDHHRHYLTRCKHFVLFPCGLYLLQIE